jgi:glutaredoxin
MCLIAYACTHVASAVGRRIFHINCPGVKEGQTHCENMSRGMMYPKVDGKCPDCLRDDDLMERAIYEHNLREKAARLVQSGRSRGMSISHILKVMVTRKDRMEPGLFDAIQEELKRTEPETERVAIKRQSIESPYVVVNQPNVPPDQSQQDIKVCDPLDGQVSDLTGNRCLDFISALPLPSFSIRSNNANTLTKLPQPRKVFSLHEQEKILSQNAAVKAIMQEQAGKEAAEAIPNIKGSAAMNIGKSLFQKGVSAWNTALKSEKHEGQVSQDGGVEARDVSSDSEDEDWVDVALLGGRRRGV